MADFNPTPMNERAVGFGGGSDVGGGMKAITPIDAEIVSEGGEEEADVSAETRAKVSDVVRLQETEGVRGI